MHDDFFSRKVYRLTLIVYTMIKLFYNKNDIYTETRYFVICV